MVDIKLGTDVPVGLHTLHGHETGMVHPSPYHLVELPGA